MTPNAERNAEIIRRRDAGEQPADIARSMGLSRNIVLGALRRAGRCDPHSSMAHNVPRPRVTESFKDQVVASWEPGKTKVVAADWRISRNTITRWRKERGQAVSRSRLTYEQVVEIRKARASGRKLTDIAAEFGIAPSYVCVIATGRARKAA